MEVELTTEHGTRWHTKSFVIWSRRPVLNKVGKLLTSFYQVASVQSRQDRKTINVKYSVRMVNGSKLYFTCLMTLCIYCSMDWHENLICLIFFVKYRDQHNLLTFKPLLKKVSSDWAHNKLKRDTWHCSLNVYHSLKPPEEFERKGNDLKIKTRVNILKFIL